MSVKPEVHAGLGDEDLSELTVLVTGSSDGIGREAALALGRLGAHVLVHGRSREKAEAVVGAIEATKGSADAYTADFSNLDGVRDLAQTIRSDVDRIDVLANNVGTYFGERQRTDAGVGATITVNHLAPFLLTHRLLPAIPDDGRIVTTASGAHRGADIDPDSLDNSGPYDGFAEYSRSKLANVLFTRELADRLTERTANCFHPGFIPGSGLWRHAPLPVRAFMAVLSVVPEAVTRRVVDTPATGAATLVYLAAAAEIEDVTGAYFADREMRDPSPAARDAETARRLWAWSEDAVDLDPEIRLSTSPP